MSLVSVSSLTKEQKARRDWYKELAAKQRKSALEQSFKAGMKRTYVMGVSVSSKRDIMSALRADLININQQCVGEGLPAIFVDEDEDDIVLPTPTAE